MMPSGRSNLSRTRIRSPEYQQQHTGGLTVLCVRPLSSCHSSSALTVMPKCFVRCFRFVCQNEQNARKPAVANAYLAKGVATTHKRNSLAVVKAHVAEDVADVFCACLGVARGVHRPGGVDIDEADGGCAEGVLTLAIHRARGEGLLDCVGAERHRGGAVGVVLPAAAEAKDGAPAGSDRHVSGEDNQIAPALTGGGVLSTVICFVENAAFAWKGSAIRQRDGAGTQDGDAARVCL